LKQFIIKIIQGGVIVEINFEITFNLIATLTGLIGWGIVAFLTYRIYKKQEVKSKGWKIAVAIVVGLFTFSINFGNEMMKISILPLGVWILYFAFRNKGESWEKYRAYAWLGFWANFIFLATNIVSIPLHHTIYPKDEPSTYISDIDHAVIIHTHPSAKVQGLNKDSLLEQLTNAKEERVYSDPWYMETYMNADSTTKDERFPYQLIQAHSKWGSGIHSIIFIENDGKGILITTSDQQLYFRTSESVLEEVEK